MNQTDLMSAITEALTDKKTVDLLAEAISKQIVKTKRTANNIEETLVKNHVVFAKEGSHTGVFMISKEVVEKIKEFASDEIVIRPRVFGKALLTDCEISKQHRTGRQYFIEAVLEEITLESLETLHKERQEEGANDLNVDFENVTPKDEKPVIYPQLLDELIAQYESPEEYNDFLETLSRKKLIKHINKYKMPIRVEGFEDDEVIASIIKFIDGYTETAPPTVIEAKEEESNVTPLISLSDFMESIEGLSNKKHKKAMKQRLKAEAKAEAAGVEALPSMTKKERKAAKKAAKKAKK